MNCPTHPGDVLKSPGSNGLWILMSRLDSNNTDFMPLTNAPPANTRHTGFQCPAPRISVGPEGRLTGDCEQPCHHSLCPLHGWPQSMSAFPLWEHPGPSGALRPLWQGSDSPLLQAVTLVIPPVHKRPAPSPRSPMRRLLQPSQRTSWPRG